jgi:hypothetical protein
MNLKSYKYSDEHSQSLEKRIRESYNTLPYSDQIHFLSEIFENAEYLFMSSGISSIAHGIFNAEMNLRETKAPSDNFEKADILYDLEKKLCGIGKTLYELQAAETKARYDKLKDISVPISSSIISQN